MPDKRQNHDRLRNRLEVGEREAAEDIVRTIHREYDNPETNKDCRNALRAFGRFLTDGDDVPGSMAWIPTSTSSNYDPSPDPGDMLDWEADVRPMIDGERPRSGAHRRRADPTV